MDLRKITVVDISAQETILCLFKETAHTFPNNFSVGDTIKITNLRSSRGSSLNTTADSNITADVEPINILHYQPLQDQIKQMSFIDFCNGKYNLPECTIKITNVLTITTYSSNSDNIYYTCNQANCRMKLQNNPSGILICTRHGPILSPHVYYKVGIQLMDANSNESWFSIFDNHVSKFTQTTAASYATLSSAGKHDVLRNICCTKVEVTIQITKKGPYTNFNLISLTVLP